MQLKNKLTIIISFVAFLTLWSLSALYSHFNNQSRLSHEEYTLLQSSIDAADDVALAITNKIALVDSFGAAPIVEQQLQKSNLSYEKLQSSQREQKIESLEKKWQEERLSKSQFIDSYLDNPLAEYLKKEQGLFPHLYGEIFITNRYGVIVATTAVLSTLSHAHKYWWKNSYNGGEGRLFLDDRGFDKSVNGYVLGVVTPIKKDGKIIGIIKSNINILGTLSSILRGYDRSKRGVLKIARTKGAVVLEMGKEPLSTQLKESMTRRLESLNTDVVVDEEDMILRAYSPVTLMLDKQYSFGGKAESIDHTKGNENEIWHVVIEYDIEDALMDGREFNKLMLTIALAISITLFLLASLLAKWFSQPIKELEYLTLRIAHGETQLRATLKSDDEIGSLARSINIMLNRLKETTTSRDALALEVKRRKEAESIVLARTEELKLLNESLNAEVQRKTQENFKQFQILQQQSKLASMGEMIGAIAHQWRQPLNEITIRIQKLKYNYEKGEIDALFLEKFIEKNKNTIRFMSNTIDDFRNFFRIDKREELFDVGEAIDEVLNIQRAQLKNHNIALRVEGESFLVDGYKREFEQVIMNLISNAKDIFIQKATQDAKIEIRLQKHRVEVEDNGGGIAEDIVDRVFEPYFTTKNEGEGTGMGLYMSKMIIEDNMGGKIDVLNGEKGALFRVTLISKKEK